MAPPAPTTSTVHKSFLAGAIETPFKRAELLTINANVGIEYQIGGGDQNVTNYRFGLDAILSFPRLVSPIRFKYDARRKALPKTNITAGYQTIIRGGLYRINSFQTTFGYAWRQNQQVEHVFQPLQCQLRVRSH